MTPEEIAALNDLLARKIYATYYRLTSGVGFPGVYPISENFDDLDAAQQAIFLSMAVSIYNDPCVKSFWERMSSQALEEQLSECPT